MVYLKLISFLLLIVPIIVKSELSSCSEREVRATMYLSRLNLELNNRYNLQSEAFYNYNINVTEENRKIATEITLNNAKFYKEKSEEIKNFGYQYIQDEYLSRQIKKLTKLDYSALTAEDYNDLMNSISSMQTNYAKVKVCSYKNRTKCDLTLEPSIEERISKSKDPEELKYYWKIWYDSAGTPVRQHFNKYIELGRKSARLNEFKSQAEVWIDEYEDEKFVEKLEKIYNEILPFYKQLHGYVRYRLRQKYGDIVSERGNIPMHLLGNLWGQTWGHIIDTIIPFPDRPFFDVTNEMLKQNYTPIKMFEMGDDFFQSLNMTKLPQLFWEKSVLEKPIDGRDIICHASAWDFYLLNDVRIKQCTRVTMTQLYTVHHELGHIQYYLQYQNQPATFRNAPNPGFHEAVGDVLALSVSTSKHLEKIGLLKNYVLDHESRINQLFEKAINKIIFLTFSYTLDKYRWSVFRGDIKDSELNCAFWKMRSNYSGVEPPIQRSEDDFDPPAKYHVSADVEYLRYFVAHILQFQFYKAACLKAGQYVPGNSDLPLDNCDFYGSSEAGNSFKAMLELGSSKPWPDAMEIFTGERDMSSSALLEYFEPLRVWLEAENKKNNVPIGWDETDKCTSSN